MKQGIAYIKLFAGLGNQLFQYSYGQFLKDSGQTIRYVLAPSENCLTEVFDVPAGEILSSANPLVASARKAFAKFIARRWYADFFAEYAYALHAKGRLRFKREAEYKKSPWFERIARGASVAIHVRGGDYLTESGYPGWGSVCGKEYYAKAIARIESEAQDPEYYVFSDDYDHAKRVLPDSARGKYYLVDDEARTGDAGFHMFLMSSCKHNVIANSTYSWWGAFLGEPDRRMVVAPARWERFTTPSEWIRIQ